MGKKKKKVAIMFAWCITWTNRNVTKLTIYLAKDSSGKMKEMVVGFS